MVEASKIKEHIVKHLKWDSSLKGSRIKVDYTGRTAILEGTVPNLLAHSMAQRDALNIPGVDSIENRLVVKFDHNHPNKADEEVRTDIQSVLGCTDGAAGGQIQVSVVDGIVSLEGRIGSYWQKERIEDLVSSIDGVLRIENNLKVSIKEKAPDNSIKKEIVDALKRMEVEGLDNVKVEVKDGKVRLSGSVPTWSISFDIEDTARYTAGVVDVKNNLAVD
jgi:osmotically-inducible protein OsmY